MHKSPVVLALNAQNRICMSQYIMYAYKNRVQFEGGGLCVCMCVHVYTNCQSTTD